MHNPEFLLEVVDITIYHGYILSNHFPVAFEFTQQLVAHFHDILRKPLKDFPP